MTIQRLAADLHIIPGLVNVYVLETSDGLAVLDTGFPNGTPKILAGVRALGRLPTDVRHIILTHCHPDHSGSAAALKRETGATVWAHPIDASRIEAGQSFRRPMTPSPGWRNWLLAKILAAGNRPVEPAKVDRFLEDGDHPSFAPDMEAVHAPGHSAGQIALLWRRRGGVLFTADACVNRRRLHLPVATEDPQLALATLARLAKLEFDAVCVMHGKPIMTGGGLRFRETSFAS